MLRRKIAIVLLLGLLPAALTMHAQTIAGQWQGTVQAPRPYRIVLKVAKERNGKLQAYIVSIDASPDHIPATSVSLDHQELAVSAPMIHGTYRGRLSSDGSRIDGTWTQAMSHPLLLQRATQATSWLTKSTIRMVAVAPHVSLEVIDWGGTGTPLIFLAGLGNTAHIFDNFAPRFVPGCHAFGITRRGFGESSSPAPSGSNYSADQLGDDVLRVIDVLGLKKPVLIGHSIAGEELSSIGSRYPDRIAGLVYLDAGYSYALYSPQAGDSQLDAMGLQKDLTEYLGRITDKQGAAAKILADLPQLQKDLEADRKRDELLPPPPPSASGAKPEPSRFADVEGAIIRGEQKYTNIEAPILAIFASPHSPAGLPPMPQDKKAEFIASDQALSAAQAKAFESLKSAKVALLPNANHFVFFSNEQQVEKDIKDFLVTLNTKEN